jgi:GntR family transcriptional regulator/MocR family aminotransferase
MQAVMVTPSRNFPLGRILSLPRRLALLQAAAQAGCWIIEDDFDAEFRFAGRPLAALFGLDEAGQVLYSGTFSRTMFPALRLGYLVVPGPLIESARSIRAAQDGGEASPLQAAMVSFLEEGHYAAQIRRRRLTLAESYQALVAAVEEGLSDFFDLVPADGGLSLTLLSRQPVDDVAQAAKAAAAGIMVRPLSGFYHGLSARQGLVLGFAGWSPELLRQATSRLARVLRSE